LTSISIPHSAKFSAPNTDKFLARQQLFERMMKQNSRADIVFLMDCTGSMTSHFAETKARIKKIINYCDNKFDGKVRSLGQLRPFFHF
jgi:hypothetical protein